MNEMMNITTSKKNSKMEYSPSAALAAFRSLPQLREIAAELSAQARIFAENSPERLQTIAAVDAARGSVQAAIEGIMNCQADSSEIMALKIEVWGFYHDALKDAGALSNPPEATLNGMAQIIIGDLRRQLLAA